MSAKVLSDNERAEAPAVETTRAKALTGEELVARCDSRLVAEFVNGVFYAHPRPAPKHARASSRLGARLIARFDNGGGGGDAEDWIILDEPELHLGGQIMVPDLAAWRRSRMPAVPDRAFFDIAPNWICEVLSKGTARFDKTEKMPNYARAGVEHAWLVSPLLRTLTAYENNEGKWARIGRWRDNVVRRPAPFESEELRLADLWAW